jgi:hypothetical protein
VRVVKYRIHIQSSILTQTVPCRQSESQHPPLKRLLTRTDRRRRFVRILDGQVLITRFRFAGKFWLTPKFPKLNLAGCYATLGNSVSLSRKLRYRNTKRTALLRQFVVGIELCCRLGYFNLASRAARLACFASRAACFRASLSLRSST